MFVLKMICVCVITLREKSEIVIKVFCPITLLRLRLQGRTRVKEKGPLAALYSLSGTLLFDIDIEI